MSKRKWYTKAIYLGVALAMTLGLVVMPVGAQHDPEIEICSSLNVAGSATAAWVNTPVGLTHTETVTVLGDYSARLSDGGAGATSYSQLILPGLNIPLPGITELSFWFNYSNPGISADYIPALSLHIDTDDDGARDFVACVTMTAGDIQYGAEFTENTWEMWDLNTSVTTVYGTGPVWHGTAGPGKTFAEVKAAAAALTPATDAVVLYVMIGEGAWGSGTWAPSTAYVDDITINDVTYDVEPCYWLEPDIAMNVKTADETFTVMDVLGEVNPALVSNWMVTKGEGTGAVSIIAGGADGDNFITVRMITMGDCIITCNVAGLYHPVDAEKKWGEIYYTELTAWSPTPCKQRPDFVGDTEISRGGIEVNDTVLVQEKVIANFLPGPVPAPAGGAKITWWLLENDAAGNAQAALEDLVELFDSYDYVSGELGWGHGCGQYGDWATPPDPTFIPEDMIDVIYALYEADDTLFIDAECATLTPATTKTVTETDHVLDPLGEGFTNVLVEFSDVTTGEVEPVIVVVLADYPRDKNGQNAVCVEYFKFTPKPPPPEITEVKTPQVRWAGEKIILEKDWSDVLVCGNYVAVYHMDEASIGTLYMGGDNNAVEVDGGDIWVWVDTSNPTSEIILETQFQGKADVEVALYEYGPYPGRDMTALFDSDEPLDSATAQTLVDGWAPLVNTGFMVYYLAFEEIELAEDISHIDNLTPRVDDAEVAVQVKGWFTCELLGPALDPDTGDVRAERIVDCDNDGTPDRVLPRGRYVLPDDWGNLAGNNYELRPNWDLMDMAHLDAIVSPEDLNNDHVEELGPYDFDVVTTDPPDEADDPCIGPFNTLQPWSVDDMWIADDVVPADFMVAAPLTWPRTAADVRNTVVPDGLLNWYDCPMPQALVLFDIVAESEAASLSGLDKGDLEGYGFAGDPKIYQSPFYCVEIPSSEWITALGYNHNSWGVDGPYDYWTDLLIDSIISNTTEDPEDVKDVEVYCDNHGIAGVTINTLIATGHVTIEATAEFPNSLKKGQYPPMTEDIRVNWGLPVEHLNADFEVSDRTGVAPITISFYGLKAEGTGLPWTEYGTPPYVKAEWDFDGDGTIDVTIEEATSALTLATQTHEFTTANGYSPWLRVTDDDGLVDICQKPNYIVLTGPPSVPLCDIDEIGGVNLADFYLFALAFGSTPADANWNADCDLVESGEVDIADFFVFAVCYDEHSE